MLKVQIYKLVLLNAVNFTKCSEVKSIIILKLYNLSTQK